MKSVVHSNKPTENYNSAALLTSVERFSLFRLIVLVFWRATLKF